MFAITIFGLIEIAVGIGVLAIPGLNGVAAPFVIALIGEGVSDIIQAISSSITGKFNWKDYAI